MSRRRILFALALGASIAFPFGWLDAKEITGKGLYKYCKSCHGSRGEGGKDGPYPRLAGMPQSYVERQLHRFKAGQRVNKPMIPIFKDQRFDADLIAKVSAYIAGLSEESLNLWPYEPSAEALAEFDSRAEFNGLGGEIFQRDCAQCHGEDGKGKEDKETPPLVNQYVPYLDKQIGDFVAGRREHEHSTKMFGEMYPEEREAIFNYLVELGK